MSRKLGEKLSDSGVRIDAEAFKSLISDTMHGMYPNWNDEELMHRPTEALRFCQAIRQATGGYDLPEEVILRALSALRKHP